MGLQEHASYITPSSAESSSVHDVQVVPAEPRHFKMSRLIVNKLQFFTRGTNVSCLRKSRRKVLLSFNTTPRPYPDPFRIKDDYLDIEVARSAGTTWTSMKR